MTKKILLALVALIGLQAAAASKEEMIRALQFIRDSYQAGYAPIDWKQKHFGLNLDESYKKSESALLSITNPTTKDFQKAAALFVQSMKDYHVAIRFQRTEKATLPFMVRGAEGRYFIVYVDDSKLPASQFPGLKNAEVIEFGGRPVGEVIGELKSQIELGSPLTDQALAEMYLTRRAAAAGFDVPKGPIDIKVKIAGEVKSFQFIWDYKSEAVADNSGAPKSKFSSQFVEREIAPLKLDMISRQAIDLGGGRAGNPFAMGEKNSFVPALGEKIWSQADDKKFSAYIFRHANGKLIGVIRIPSYSAGAEELKEFKEITAKFEKSTDALVIDQVNNPGGAVFYLYSLVSVLSSTVVPTPKHHLRLTQKDVLSAAGLLDQLATVKDNESAQKVLGPLFDGAPASYQDALFVKQYSQFIVDQWGQGHSFTSATHLWGVDQINPDPTVRYTKPILLLVNELDFSGGDFFPTILQDAKRARVMGTRTSGAGGYVLTNQFMNNLGVSLFSITGSIAQRADGNPIENLGVTPDVEYALTAKDYETGTFQGYKDAILKEVEAFFK